MFLRTLTCKSTETYYDKIDRLRNELKTADAVVIGAGARLSTSAGMSYSGERFEKTFADFHQKYGITDMYSGGMKICTSCFWNLSLARKNRAAMLMPGDSHMLVGRK